MAAPPAPPSVPLHPVSVHDIQAWMIIRWSSLVGIDLPPWLIDILSVFFPPSTYEGVIVELTSLTLDYGLNEIPTATAGVGVGFNMRDHNVVAAIHYLSQYLKLFVAGSIWVQVRRTHISGAMFYTNQWPAGPFRVFDGYIVGTGFRKTTQGIDFTLQMTHWLSNLNFSSVLSRSSSPQNPGQVSFDPALPEFPNAGARDPNGFRHAAYMTQLLTSITAPVIREDLWGKVKDLPPAGIPADLVGLDTALFAEGVGGMKGWMTDLCKQDRINWRQFQTGLCDGVTPAPSASKNVEALSALRRIEPLRNGYIDGVPLAIKDLPGTQNIANQIAMALAYQMPEALANHTMWDKIVGEFGTELQFALVPQVEKAMIVPFNPGLRKVWTTIYASEIDFFEQNHHIPRPLRGVGMFIGREFASGGGVSLNQHPVYNTIGAYYENPKRRNGMVVFKKAPRWLSTVVMPHLYVAGGQDTVIGTGIEPAPAAPAGRERPPRAKIEDSKNLWCQYARGLYIQEVLRGRSGRISGRLRFDIAPGSIVKVEEPDEPFVLQRLQRSQSFVYAQVVRTSIMINSEAQKAGTAFQLAFIKDAAENTDAAYSIDTHPIWKHDWVGAPLVNHRQFYFGTARDI